MIIVYHAFRLIQGLEARMPRFNSSAIVWEAPGWHSMTWLGMFLDRKPEMCKKTKLVIFDEKDASKSGNWAPEGTFKLIQRQATRYPEQYFAIPLQPFRGEVLERGLDLFQSSVTVLTWFENLLQKQCGPR